MIINEKIARQSQWKMRTRRPLDLEIGDMMERISDKLREKGKPTLNESSLRMVAIRNRKLGGRR